MKDALNAARQDIDADVVVLGAGAAGLMCAITAGARGRRALVLDHAKAAGEKIRISGGGRCNFTNLHSTPANFLSENPSFCISALQRYTPADFIALVDRHGIAWHEKTLGQLFCDGSSRQIVDMLLAECADAGVAVRLDTEIAEVRRAGDFFEVQVRGGPIAAGRVVIATGGLSIPKMGATRFGYAVAEQFGLPVVAPRPGLVPFRLAPDLLAELAELSGVAVDAEVRLGKEKFREAMLFTHRGLSGPAILQISSYWREGETVDIDMAPGTDVFALLKEAKSATPRLQLQTALARLLPRRLAHRLARQFDPAAANLADLPDARLRAAADAINRWRVVPAGTEGFRTAEVTVGGVDTRALSSRTMEARSVPGLYFIGEVVDVTGHLGGHNFQWAWASGFAAGQAV
jgi:predicted Rossmann fold flavoprotein